MPSMHKNLIVDLASRLTSSKAASTELSQAEKFVKNEEYLANVAKDLKKICETKDLNTMLAAEKMMLAHEEKNLKSKEHEQSVKKALSQFEFGKNSLTLIENKVDYYKASTSFGDKESKQRDKDNLPKDNFRQFVDSHESRLQNRLKNPASDMDKLVIEQRLSNMREVEKIYIGKQKEAITVGAERLAKADDIRKLSSEEFLKKHPDSKKEAEALQAGDKMINATVGDQSVKATMQQGFREGLAKKIEKGDKFSDLPTRAKEQEKPAKKQEPDLEM